MTENHFYIGIDIDDRDAVVSYYHAGMKEPETLSMVNGSEAYLIPVAAARRGEQWVFGKEAVTMLFADDTTKRQDLVTQAVHGTEASCGETVYPAEELLGLYIRKLVLLTSRLGNPKKPEYLVFTLEKVTARTRELFEKIGSKIGTEKEKVILLERTESFFYFAYSQKHELWLHDITLFDCRMDRLSCSILTRNTKTVPQVVSSSQQEYQLDCEKKDEDFCQIIAQVMEKRICSSVYLTGEGFDGNWMQKAPAALCRGRRAFIGKNLYARGACYAALVKDGQTVWPYVYMGGNVMKVNVSLKVAKDRKTEFLSVIDAGENWYDVDREYEVIAGNEPAIDLWLQFPYGRNAKIEKLELSGFPEWKERTTRLRISVKALSDTEVHITIKDLGFGELRKSTGRRWEYTMTL